MAASVAHPVFGRFARPPELPPDAPAPGTYDAAADAAHRRRPVADRLHLVPPATLPQALDRPERVAPLFTGLPEHVIPHAVKSHGQAPAVPALTANEGRFERVVRSLL